jgi:hypothetical protein
VPGVAAEQLRGGVEDEREDRAVGLDEIECLLQGVPGGHRVGERGARRPRVTLGQPQRREGVTHLPASGIVQPGQGLFGTSGFTYLYERLQHVRSHRCRAEVLGDEQTGRPFGGLESGHRLAVAAARELERPAGLVEHHPGRRFDLAAKRTLGVLQQGLRLLQAHLPDPYGTEARVGGGHDRFLSPAVLLRQLDRLQIPLGRQPERPEARGPGPVGQGADPEPGPPALAR